MAGHSSRGMETLPQGWKFVPGEVVMWRGRLFVFRRLEGGERDG